MNLIFDWAGTLADDQELDRHNRYAVKVALWPGVHDALAYLSQKHRLFVLSSLDQQVLESSLKILGIARHFKFVKGSASDKKKGLAELITSMELSLDETVFICDDVNEIEAAHAAGIAPLAVSYGNTSAQILRAAEPELIFHSFQSLLRHFDKLSFAESRFFPVATVGGLIFDQNDKMLLVRTRKWSNRFGVPGGKIDYGETMEAAFVREAKEETGLDIYDVIFVMNQEAIEHPEFYRPRHYILVNYTAKVAGLEPTPKLNHESDAFVWVSIAEAMKMDLNEPTKILIEKVFQNQGAK